MARRTGCGDASHYDFLARLRAFGFKMIGWVGKVEREGGRVICTFTLVNLREFALIL
jgi:hypothetical protein